MWMNAAPPCTLPCHVACLLSWQLLDSTISTMLTVASISDHPSYSACDFAFHSHSVTTSCLPSAILLLLLPGPRLLLLAQHAPPLI